ncbi:MAG: SurA N-terminal domain-containing protein [Oligoflexia bacterium]|nr:SurA N-terminal domain-containing protein [Oligoflexia bacterium]MBF0365987.1 SurA N-terminal domain-containing protein [Oligoflexia bacterium]
MSSFQKKSASIIASLFIGLIILSFMFSGYYTKMGSGQIAADSVANVDGMQISGMEYQRAFASQIEFYKKVFKIQDLTTQQIEQYNIKQEVLNQLVNQKLLIGLANRYGINPSAKEIAHEIQNQKYFQNGDQFDINIYKELLSRNGYTPSDYEAMVADDLKSRAIYKILAAPALSNGYLKQRSLLKNDTAKVQAVRITRDSLKDFLDLPAERIQKYADDAANKSKIEGLFNARKAELDQKEKIEVRHILLVAKDKEDTNAGDDELKSKIEALAKEVTPANFAKMAEEKSDDPSAKGKGGLIGWIEKGQLVPEFENAAFALKPGVVSAPVKTAYGYHLILVTDKKEEKIATLEEHKLALAKELIQKESTEERKKIEDAFQAEIQKFLESGDKAALIKAQEKYKFTLAWDKFINILDEDVDGIILNNDTLSKIFALPEGKKEIFVLSDANTIVLVNAQKEKAPVAATAENNKDDKGEKEKTENPTVEKESQKRAISDSLREETLKYLKEQVKIKIHSNLI